MLLSTHNSDDLASFNQEYEESMAREWDLNIQKTVSEKVREFQQAQVRIRPVVKCIYNCIFCVKPFF